MSARPKMLQEAIELAKDLMDQKVRTYAERHANNKRRFDNNPGDNQVQQQPFKRQNVARAYTARPGEKQVYAGTLPLCNKSLTTANNKKTLTFFECGNLFECGNQVHYKSDCPKLKNQGHGNQSENGEACGRDYALGGGEADQDLNDDANYIDA
ncbi:hypothetical protein Tco_0306879 [Tanacetum coccineum]